ncbi:MAG: polysaccharide biosynthesis protein [Sedimentisphaerales bacterium]|nr:polysaccharide biosynthesis protein [Sedimentisphaerales bacterium]
MDSDTGANMRSWHLYMRKVGIILAHIVFFAISLFMAFTVYSNMEVGDWFPRRYFTWLLVTISIKLVVFGIFRQYQGWWRYASITDLLSIIKASHLSTVIIVVGWYTAMFFDSSRMQLRKLDIENVAVAVMLVDWAGTIVVICGARLAIRLYYEETQTVASGRLSRLLIIGAGNAGEVLLREIFRMPVLRYDVVGFLDDDPRKHGVRINGVPVLGTTEQVKKITQQSNVDEIVIAMPSVSHKKLRRVIELCQGTNLRFSTIPDLVAIASGRVRVSQMREVDINDLLGRDPVNLDMDLISRYLKDKVVMVTGAGGSIGSEMCRQIGLFQPKTLLLIEQAENALFFIERELNGKFPNTDIQAYICDIADKVRVEFIFEKHRPEVVIHAAAHKHVPLMELNSGEAIKNNVVGTRNMAFAADKYGAGNFVMISTDKAVNPTSIMGSSKRLAEMSIQCLDKRSQTQFVTVRFGNVLGSNGSVIPIFRQQIAAGGPVTVTHPEMQRYFMTIPEASQLVLQAATMGRGGEIFVLDMGEPVKIVDLARDLITLSGFRLGDDIEIQFTGMRPGEKLFEELAMDAEDMGATRHPKISIWKNVPADEQTLNQTVERLLRVADRPDSHARIVSIIKEVVPEYVGDVDSLKLHEEHISKAGNNNNHPEKPSHE